MTSDLQNAFPTRPLRILRHGAGSSWLSYLVGLAFLAGTIAFGAWQIPPLLSDNQIRQDPVVVPGASVRNGKCRTRKFVFTECEADIAYTVDGKRYTHHPDFFFIDFSPEGYSTGVVRSATKPELGTMSIAIDYFWNRVMTVLGFTAILGAIAAFCFLAGFRNGRLRRAASGEAAPLLPVPATITQASKVWGGASYAFKAVVGGKERSFTSKFGKDEAPFRLADGRFLAATPQHSATVVLLDEGLQRLDLTDEEREAVWRAAYPSQPQAA